MLVLVHMVMQVVSSAASALKKCTNQDVVVAYERRDRDEGRRPDVCVCELKSYRMAPTMDLIKTTFIVNERSCCGLVDISSVILFPIIISENFTKEVPAEESNYEHKTPIYSNSMDY